MFYSRRDLHFHLYEVIQAEKLTQLPHFADHDRMSFDMVLEAAGQISETLLRPLLTVMDREEPQLVAGKIRVHPQMKSIIKRFGDDGWINAPFTYEEGGQQLPATIMNAATFIFGAANYSSSVFPFLTTGAANLLRSFGSKELIDRFTPPMYAGRWQGTMALTEPDAGSSLSDITTSAEATNVPGEYRIRGQKIYISAGDHDACENVVHLMLAKIKGGPAGAKGISLFAVPQKRPKLGESTPGTLVDNDVQTAGVYHKMGYKGAPIAHLMVGSGEGAVGYLVGEPHQGLRYMFQMMNEARIGVGMNAVSIGTAAYYASLDYARERPQGRPIAEKDPVRPQVPIIYHADVRRMLLFQKSVLEGSLGLVLQCSYYADVAHAGAGEVAQNAALLLDLLTPIAKSYPSEMGCLTTSAAVQILGGAGYTTDFLVEQFYREARIHPIHEGTTGIHGLDLLGRKVTQHGGKGIQLLIAEMQKAITEATTYPALTYLASQLSDAIGHLTKVTTYLLGLASDPAVFLADATLYLELFGIVTLAWQWLRQATVAQAALAMAGGDDQAFYNGKLMAARYFYEYELVKTLSLAHRLQSADRVTLEMHSDWF